MLGNGVLEVEGETDPIVSEQGREGAPLGFGVARDIFEEVGAELIKLGGEQVFYSIHILFVHYQCAGTQQLA